MVQGGDPTDTGKGGQSIWGSPFPDEFQNVYTHGTSFAELLRDPYTNNENEYCR